MLIKLLNWLIIFMINSVVAETSAFYQLPDISLNSIIPQRKQTAMRGTEFANKIKNYTARSRQRAAFEEISTNGV